MKAEDILNADLAHVRKLLIESEQNGEKRVNFLMSFATAVGAGLVTLNTSEAAKNHAEWVHDVTVASLLALLLVSLVVYLRLLRRNRLTDHYGQMANVILHHSKKLVARGDTAKTEDNGAERQPFKYEPCWRPYEGPIRKRLHGGYAQTVALIMGILSAALFALWAGLSASCSGALGLLVFLLFWAVQEIDRSYKKKPKKKEEGPSHA